MTNAKNPSKVVLVDYEERMSREKAATFLKTLAKRLREEGSFTLTQGEEKHEVSPSALVELEVKLKKENDKKKFEVVLEWNDVDKGLTLSIE